MNLLLSLLLFLSFVLLTQAAEPPALCVKKTSFSMTRALHSLIRINNKVQYSVPGKILK
jgi:hypothetical protein